MPQQELHKHSKRRTIRIGRIIGALLPFLIFLAGIGLLLYPTFSDWWNERHQSRAIATYEELVEQNDDEEIDQMLAAAEAYNESVLEQRRNGTMSINDLTDEQVQEYNALLDVTGTGIMGYVKIPKIDVELPIYHGTDEAVLQVAIGHIGGTSLPIGGKGTHAVISGHRGLPSARLFTDIDSLGEGDIFIVTCLNHKITYQVDQIVTVLPEELDALEIDPDEDYCTLVTCTPYGINSHRLLVRGHRIDNLIDADIETIHIDIPERELSDQERLQQMLPYILILAAGFLGLALILPGKRRQNDPATGAKEHGKRARGTYVPQDDTHDDDESYQPYGYESAEHADDRRRSRRAVESDAIEFYDTCEDVFSGRQGETVADILTETASVTLHTGKAARLTKRTGLSVKDMRRRSPRERNRLLARAAGPMSPRARRRHLSRNRRR